MASLVLMAAPVLADHEVSGPAVAAVFVDGNPTCPEGTVEVKFDDDKGEVASGSDKNATVDGVSANIEITWTNNYKLNFDADRAQVAHVFVKGGNGANHYDYTGQVGGGSYHDDGLLSPNNDGGNQARISHVTFCLIPESDDDASLNILKRDTDRNPLAGAVFTVEGLDGTFTTGADGKACIQGLPDNTKWMVTEIQAPPGYVIADPATREVRVDNDGDCDSPDVVYVNEEASESPSESASESPSESPSESASESPSESPSESASESPSESVSESPSSSPSEGELGGNPTPKPGGGSIPDTALGSEGVPAWPFALLTLLSLGGLVYLRLSTETEQTR
ncbi:MAG: prealbumin-like fold domain-containing protein [Chloroflexi bacterium]|nr:prealbumin-like fold domain-containing protein [Chloroflexota bacterium]